MQPSHVIILNGRRLYIDADNTEVMLALLLKWQQAAWAGDAYKYCEASDMRDAILDELLGEGTSPSNSDNNQNNKGDI